MKILRFLLSPVFMGILLVVFAVAMGIATFIENDFGPAASRAFVYDTRWFEIIILLLALNLAGQLITRKLFRKDKLPVALFHISFILMITGAGITRYFGWEGSMHIREGETVKACYSSDQYISYSATDVTGQIISKFSGKYSNTGKFVRKISYGDRKYYLTLTDVIPNAVESVVEKSEGNPVISFLVAGDNLSNKRLVLRKGESKKINAISIGFESQTETDIKIYIDSGRFFISSHLEMGLMRMSEQEVDPVNISGKKTALEPMQIISAGDLRFVPREMTLSGITEPVAVNPDQQNTGMNAFIFRLRTEDQMESVVLWSSQDEYVSEAYCGIDDLEFRITLGVHATDLPFSLRLDDFILERYPGSDSPSGYKSEVTVIDKADDSEWPFTVFMNNVLKHKRFRFYQSSYDPDEQGTILSVNHDPAGMMVTYAGYGSLFLFIVISLIIRNSSFRTTKAGTWTSLLRKGVVSMITLFFASSFTPLSGQMMVPGRKSADEFGKVLVQDQKGRTKPLYSLAGDILRKISREDSFDGYTPMQVFLGIYFDFENWKDVRMIRISNKELQERINLEGNMAAFTDLVDLEGRGAYLISEEVDNAYSLPPAKRNRMDKEIMKVDERVNIIYMIYRGDFMKIFPLKDGTDKWGSFEEALTYASGREDSLYLNSIMPLTATALTNDDRAAVSKITESVNEYQERFSSYSLPSGLKIKAEILYYKMGIFERLFPFYMTLGIIMLTLLIINVIKEKKILLKIAGIFGWLLLTGFLLHTFGLVLRWYISGHSPMSNGYESMIFISWVTLLAGFIFSRRSLFTLSATSVLAGLTLMVAHLSFMDPEITNLVPVLQSYWLTLHVSVITGSYGFLGLGAILGLINLILISLTGINNLQRISVTVDELTLINYRTLTLGLYFLTIGTFLGAIWANESWGRYWGWDPKETWSLITIIVYTFITHSRLIPGLKDIYTFNLLSLFGFSSVLMTYFGVNYYLSGLHSYAGGDPVPVPAFVYITILVLVSLAVYAWYRYQKIRE